MLNTLRRLIQRYGFFRRAGHEPSVTWWQTDYTSVGGLTKADVDFAASWQWQDADFYTEEKRRNERLAQITRERNALKEKLAKAVRDKKARAPIYQALRALSVEELRVESGK